MSYLQFPRISFSGLFRADVSTVNNDPRHFDNANFEEHFQELQTTESFNGWWNPVGTGIFSLVDCSVKSVLSPDGAEYSDPAEDAAIGLTIGNSLDRPAGKLVDLDPDWQLASAIFGMQVTLLQADGTPLLTADFATAPFRDLTFSRSAKASNDSAASAMFQSVLVNLRWGDIERLRSPVLTELRRLADETGALSIRLTTYGYDAAPTDAYFSYGALVGAIGPARIEEPRSFVLGRRFVVPNNQSVNGSNPGAKSGFTFFPSQIVDRTLQADLSNSMPLICEKAGTPLESYRVLPNGPEIAFALLCDPDIQPNTTISPRDYHRLAPVDYSRFRQIGGSGIQSVALDDKAVELARAHPFALVNVLDDAGTAYVVMREGADGLEVRAEEFVFRLDPNLPEHNVAPTTLYVAQYGVPLPGRRAAVWSNGPAPDFSDSPTDADPVTTPRAAVPVTNAPHGAVRFVGLDQTSDVHGRIRIELQGPEHFGRPRNYLDGQFYNFSYNLADGTPTLQQQFDQLAVLVFSSFEAGENVSWDQVEPILRQYANLYPIMSRGLFDFSKKEIADANAEAMLFVFDKPLDDPDQMPVTRDLSWGKRQALIRYFRGVIASQPPLANAVAPRNVHDRIASRCPFSGRGLPALDRKPATAGSAS